MDTQLNFINKSDDQNNSDIVIFQKNVAKGHLDLPVVWLVIRNCGVGDIHPFIYPQAMQVSVADSYGNYAPQLDARPGQLFSVILTESGDTLAPSGSANNPGEVQVVNSLARGAITAKIYKARALLSTSGTVSPGQMAAFEFKPTIWIGAVPQVVQGSVMNSAVVAGVDTELSLLGIASADIVMTGGGSGPNAMPFEFNLQNIISASKLPAEAVGAPVGRPRLARWLRWLSALIGRGGNRPQSG